MAYYVIVCELATSVYDWAMTCALILLVDSCLVSSHVRNVRAVTVAVIPLCRFVRTVAVKIGVDPIATAAVSNGTTEFFYVGYVVFTVDT